MEKFSKKALKEQYRNRTIVGGVYCIKCNDNIWIRPTTNMQGAKNRFEFSVYNNYCPEGCMLESWKQFGAVSFSFEILEEIEKKKTQTDDEFLEDVNTLLELWTEKLKVKVVEK
jgi:hypothetical protein